MTGYTKDENSLAAGTPDRTIGPETGPFGNAVKTNTGDTSQGTNQDHESRPAPAANLGGAALTTDDLGERRSFDTDLESTDMAPPSDVESVAQQIADGGDRFDPDKHLNELEQIEAEEADEAEDDERPA